MTITYNPALVMLSVFIAITGSVTGLALAAGYDRRGRRSLLSLIKGAFIVGSSIWAMHFVAILAMRFPVPVTYNSIEVAVALYFAIVCAGFGLFFAHGRRLGAVSPVIAGSLMGAAIATAHYLGMKAIRGCGVEFGEASIIATVIMAVSASTVALAFAFRRRGTREVLIGGLLLGLTIPAVHFAALAATAFRPLRNAVWTNTLLLTQRNLAYALAFACLLICGVFLLLFVKLAFGPGAAKQDGGGHAIRVPGRIWNLFRRA